MNDQAITDLRQFITAAMGQQTADLQDQIDRLDISLNSRIDNLDHKVSQRIDDLMAMIGDVLYNTSEENNRQFKNHERRIRRLEKKFTA